MNVCTYNNLKLKVFVNGIKNMDCATSREEM